MSDITQMINHYLDEMYQFEVERKEKIIAKMIEENDFLCGNFGIKEELEESFPNMNIYYSPLIDENQIIMIKKFTKDDLIKYEMKL